MIASSRTYRIGGHLFQVSLEAPWSFKELTPQQEALSERLRRGEDIGIIPVPADRQEQLAVNDELMGKEAMTREKWEALSPAQKDEFRHALDFQQYAPFQDNGTPIATLTVHAGVPEALAASRSEWKRVTAVDETLPIYYGYRYDGSTIYEYYPAKDVLAGYFVLNGDYTRGDYYPCPKMGPRTTLMQVNTSLMILFTFVTAPLGTILLHASVTRHLGKANLFFGVSGTGKSTHSRLWHQYVPDSDLMNDDNPVIRILDGQAIVFGTPWSGKTLCYRNVQAPVRALVRLEQAPANQIERLEPLQAYASVIAAASTIRWDSSVMNHLVPTVEHLAMTVPCYHLGCRPDEEAVRVCRETIEKQENN